MSPRRSEKIERAVAAGLRRWPEAAEPMVTEPQQRPAYDLDVVRSMPRRKIAHKVDTTHITLPMARRVVFRPGIIRPIVRLFLWFWATVRFYAGNFWDVLTGRASIQRRARRLRLIFEDMGASFSKLGQQLSLRADLLPYAYCTELSKMLDRARPFPTAQAIGVIERSLGRPLGEIFEAFDPDPIGSASLACVFQAKLRTGEQVAVKVRRPGIGITLAADLRALDWLLILGESLTFIRPGMTANFRKDLRKMLLGELNFRAEARYTEMFRLRTEKDGDGVTAPRVYFPYCSEEVLVNDLVSGIWMWELMAAVDADDQEFLAHARSLNINPTAVAKRLVRALHRELLEHAFFHADPHPANLVVLPNSRICFIDFGAVGRFTTETRKTWRELQYHMRNHDIGRMVHSSINLAGPLPPVDVENVLKATEEIYADWVYAVTSTDAEWWERSTAQNWLRYINVAREFGIPVSLETIQFFRATLLYDSIIVRLDKDLNPINEYKSYARQAGKAARQRVRKNMRKRSGGLTNTDYLRIEQITDTVNQFFFRIQRSVEDPLIQFRNIVGKIAYSLSVLLKVLYFAASAIGVALGAEFIARRWFGREISWRGIAEWMVSFDWVYVILIVVGLVLMRRILIRLSAPDKKPDAGR